MNAAGDAVGTSGFHAVIYRAGGAVDLNTVIEGGAGPWTLEKAWSISASGVIVGDGSLLGFPRAFALYPCSGACCDDIDFNRDGLFPDTVDIRRSSPVSALRSPGRRRGVVGGRGVWVGAAVPPRPVPASLTPPHPPRGVLVRAGHGGRDGTEGWGGGVLCGPVLAQAHPKKNARRCWRAFVSLRSVSQPAAIFAALAFASSSVPTYMNAPSGRRRPRRCRGARRSRSSARAGCPRP